MSHILEERECGRYIIVGVSNYSYMKRIGPFSPPPSAVCRHLEQKTEIPDMSPPCFVAFKIKSV